MKKAIALLLTALILISMTACSGNTSKDGKPLTFMQVDEKNYSKNMIETKEGVYIMCSAQYVLGPGSEQFLILWDSNHRGNLDDASENERSVTFVSNSNIYRMTLNYYDKTSETVECYDIAQISNMSNVESIVLYLSYNYENYYAKFIVSGA